MSGISGSPGTVKIAIRGLAKSFTRSSSATSHTVFENIDLDIAPNSFVSIVGHSGCGKSTLVRIVAGLVPATSGEVRHDDQPVLGPSARRGMVFQKDAVFPWLTVRQNIEYGPRVRGVSATERRRAAERWCHDVGLESFADAYPKELSGGMRKRVDLARVYANSPDVLLMDEPFGALDAQTKETMQHELLKLWSTERKTVLFVTHDLDEATFLSDSVVVMAAHPGRIAEIVPIELPRPRSAEMRVSDAFVHAKRRLWEALERTSHEQVQHGAEAAPASIR
jgi:NitT/TauT family transport system ATP-binding protein